MTNEEKSSPRVALVTGASRGIGRAIAVALGAEGCHVIINYKSREDDARTTLAKVEAAGGTGEINGFDVADTEAATRAVEAILAEHGRVDILVNNAGIRRDTLIAWMEPEAWREVLETNLTGFYNVTRPIAKDMLLKRSGRIVNIASASGQSGVPGQVNYSAAKAGLIGATKALAKEVARRGVTVNAVCPGFIETEMLEGLDEKMIKQLVPMRRMGTPEEVAAAVIYLCSEGAGYTTGAEISLNGGMF